MYESCNVFSLEQQSAGKAVSGNDSQQEFVLLNVVLETNISPQMLRWIQCTSADDVDYLK